MTTSHDGIREMMIDDLDENEKFDRTIEQVICFLLIIIGVIWLFWNFS
jgi:hypothetical protein